MPLSMFTEAYGVLVNTLIEARKTAGINQTELGRRLGKGQKYVSVIETGVRRVDLIEFVAIAKALKRDPSALFTETLQRLPDEFDI